MYYVLFSTGCIPGAPGLPRYNVNDTLIIKIKERELSLRLRSLILIGGEEGGPLSHSHKYVCEPPSDSRSVARCGLLRFRGEKRKAKKRESERRRNQVSHNKAQSAKADSLLNSEARDRKNRGRMPFARQQQESSAFRGCRTPEVGVALDAESREYSRVSRRVVSV